MRSSVGLVVPTMGNRIDWLGRCLESIENQRVSVELVVVAADDSPSVSEVCSQYNCKLLFQPAHGLSAAVNFGWSHLIDSCGLLGWLGDDDYLLPGSLSAVVAAFEQNPSVAGVYGNVRYVSASDESLFTARPGRLGAAYSRVGKDLIPQPGSMLSKDFLAQSGFLDEGLSYAMDLDVFLRAMHFGGLAYVDRTLACFRLHETSITGLNTDSEESNRVRERYLSAGLRAAIRRLRPIIRVTDRAMYRYSRERFPRSRRLV